MLKAFETEVVEFEEANNSYSFKDMSHTQLSVVGYQVSSLGINASVRRRLSGSSEVRLNIRAKRIGLYLEL